MKFRKSFVTNSSSSSFIIAKRDELTEIQKEQLLQVMNEMLGKKVASTKEELQKYFTDEYSMEFDENGEVKQDSWSKYYEAKYKEALKAIESGLSIYSKTIDFEIGYDISYLYRKIFKALDDKTDNYIGIDTDLSY